jgi:type IV secretory pathway VirD2 relaxase
VIKTRIVYLNKAGTEGVAAHLRYIAREGVAKDGGSAERAYDANTEGVDLEEFRVRGSGDRHQFRFIIAPEDASELADLRGFTRNLMDRMARDLGTRLDWVAVDHWDTENPHTHVVLRGRDESGKDLVIAGEYLSNGMRVRASALATSWLGLRTDAELQASLNREMDREHWTSLDRQLKGRIHDRRVDLELKADWPRDLRLRSQLIGRLRYLQKLGLARIDDQGRWQMREDAEEVLRKLGERGDIIRTMQRTFTEAQREFSVFDPGMATDSIIGRVVDKGLADELGDRGFVVIDGVDGRAHYVHLPSTRPFENLPLGGIVEVQPIKERTVDQNIIAATANGRYLPRDHMNQLRTANVERAVAADVVGSHVRRLEALRRAGIVDRVSDGLWRIPADLVARGMEYDRRKQGGMTLHLHCHVSIERQIKAIGVTWLDQQLVEGKRPSAAIGFAAAASHALDQRAEFLVKNGLAERRGSQVSIAANALRTLRDSELATVARSLSAERGRPYRPVQNGDRVGGTYQRSIQLTSGRFALLDNGLRFSLVPWKPVIDKQLGRSINAVVRGEQVIWQVGRSRTPSIW